MNQNTQIAADKKNNRNRVIALLLAISVSFSLLIPFPKWGDGLIVQPFSDFLHLFVGFIGTVIIINIFGKRSGRFIIHPPLAGALALALSLLFEVLQGLTGRSGTFIDLFISFWGILAAVFWLDAPIVNGKRKVKFMLISGVFFAIGLLVSIPPIIFGYETYKLRERLFPVILNTNSGLRALIFPIENSNLQVPDNPLCAVKIKSEADTWSGIDIPTGDKDWSGFEALSIYIENGSNEDLRLLLRIDDSGDVSESNLRFGQFIDLVAYEKKTIIVPISSMKDQVEDRVFNLKEIRRIIISSVKEQEAREFCVGEMRLVNDLKTSEITETVHQDLPV